MARFRILMYNLRLSPRRRAQEILGRLDLPTSPFAAATSQISNASSFKPFFFVWVRAEAVELRDLVRN
jgi:hypothetical protein